MDTTGLIITPPIAALMELFRSELQGVQFPDMDAAVLAAGAAEVHERAAEVARAEEALAAARSAMEQGQEALLQKAGRALAYARIYAETDEALTRKLEAIALPRLPRRGVTPPTAEGPIEVPRKRGRPPTVRPAATLFAEEATAPAPVVSP
jgi:hypothetical protein